MRLFLRRHWSRLLPLGLLALALLIAAGLASWQALEAARQARHAEAASRQLLEVLTGADPRQVAARPAAERSVKSLLDERLETLLQTRSLAPEALEALLDRAATIYVYLDEPLPAVRLQQRRVELLAARLNPSDAGLLDARLALVWALQAAELRPEAATQIALLQQQLKALQPQRLHAELALARHDQTRLEGAASDQREALLHEARQLYRRHAPEDSGHAAALLNLGQLRLEAGQADAAQRLFDEGLALQQGAGVASQCARLLAARGLALLQLGDAESARRDSLAAVALMRGSIGLAQPGSWAVLAQALRLLCHAPTEAASLLAEVPAAQRAAYPRSALQLEQALAACR